MSRSAEPPGSPSSALSRRQLLGSACALAGGLGMVLAGCSSGPKSDAVATPGPVALDERVRRSAAAVETTLAEQASGLSRAWAAAGRPSGLVGLAAAASAAHTVHASVLLHGLAAERPNRRPGQATTGASTGAAATPSGSSTVAATTPRSGAALATAMDAAAAGYLGQLGPLAAATASTLASVAASDSAFAALLRTTGR